MKLKKNPLKSFRYSLIKKKLPYLLPPISVFITPSISQGAESLPWDSALTTLSDSLENTFLRVATVAAIIIFGLILAFSEENHGVFRRAIKVIFGLSIACSAASFGLSFFGFNG